MWEDLIEGMPSGGDLSGLEMPSGQDWMSGVDWGNAFSGWQMPEPMGGWDPQTGWPGNIYGAGGPVGLEGKGDGSWNWSLPKLDPNAQNWLKGAGELGKFGFGAWQAIDRSQQMADYNKAVQDYYKKQSDYIKQKQQWESDFVNQFKGAQEEFAGANEEFQGQIGAAQEQLGAAQGKAEEVMGQFLNASKPLLAQSQELLVPGVAALAKGNVPEQWEPILNEARLRGTTAMVQSMVSAGMSPEEARAAAQPVAEQQAQTMLLQLATNMIQQGGQLSQYGMAGLSGAGQMTDVMGKMAGIQGQLAAAGMGPETQEFAAMAQIIGRILGGDSSLPPPPKPAG